MGKSRAELRREFLATVALNRGIFGMKTTGVASVDTAIKREWPNLPDRIEGHKIFREKHEPLPKFERVLDPEEIHRINMMNDAQSGSQS